MWLLPQGLVNGICAPAHGDHAVWAVYVALASASGPDGRGCHHTWRATARLVPDMSILLFGRLEPYRWVVEQVGRFLAQPG